MGLPSTQPTGKPSSSYLHHDAADDHDGYDVDLKKPFATGSTAATTASSLPAYLSLVQQYLSVFMVDNATFLAERCAAEHPGHPDAVYLLALCYYRSGSPRRARLALENGSVSQPTPQMRYLSARCSYELRDYGRAEDALLQECRRTYHRRQHQHPRQGDNHASNNSDLPMDDWIAQTTPCPVPNGAAGLALLGSICRKSNRPDRATKYFQMSLQLDPFLWTSFEALAELNAPNLRVGDVFGVESAIVAAGAAAAASATGGSLFGGGRSRLGVPVTAPDKGGLFDGGGSGLGFSGAAADKGGLFGGGAAAASLPQGPPPLQTPAASSSARGWTFAMGAPTTTATGPPSFAAPHTAATSSSLSAVRPRGTLVDTPGLTPIPVQNSFVHFQPTPPPVNRNNLPSSSAAATPTSSHPLVLRRARDVAARKYYPPSPDTPLTRVTHSMKYLRGLGPTLDEEDAFTAVYGAAGTTTPATVGGPGRSLFLSTENSQQARGGRGGPAGAAAPPSSSFPPTSSRASSLAGRGSVAAGGGDDPGDDRDRSAVDDVLEILSVAGAAYQALCEYRCRDALSLLRSLPPKHLATGWALHQQGRALLELNEFQDAQRCLELMQSKDPGRIKGLELLSTVYWQMKKEVELSYLSQKVVDMDRLAPEAWCVVGNCFSLQKDHESALVFFKRSLQLDYGFTYTHTLSGYEYMANEDFDKAISCFRQALRIDDRHYNAWYGLGAIYHRQEKYDLAEYHFGKAVQINPGSSVLRCNLGIAQNANGKPYQALDTLAGAFRLDPRNPQARFQRATIYSALNRPEEALQELRRVRDAAPREATVHFAMGKVLKRLGRPEEAMKCFLTAMDLDPKENQTIKSAMDKLDEPDVDEEAMSTF